MDGDHQEETLPQPPGTEQGRCEFLPTNRGYIQFRAIYRHVQPMLQSSAFCQLPFVPATSMARQHIHVLYVYVNICIKKSYNTTSISIINTM